MELRTGVVEGPVRRVGAVVMRAAAAVVRRERSGRRHCGRLARRGRLCDRWWVVGAGRVAVVVWRVKAVAERRTEVVVGRQAAWALQKAGVVVRESKVSATPVEEQVASCQLVVVAWASHQGHRGTRLAGGCS